MIKYDSSTISNVADSGAVRTFSHTVADYGDRVLVVASVARGGVTISSVTFNGDTLTKAVDTQLGGDERTEIWYILDPDVGTHDVVVTYSATQTLGVVASSYYNVASVGGTDENTDSAVTSSSTTLTNDGGAGIIDVIGFQSGYYSSPSSSSGFSRIEDDNNANMGIAVGHKLSADEDQTSTWTFSSNYITHSSVVLVPEKRLLSTSSIDHFGTDAFGTDIVGRNAPYEDGSERGLYVTGGATTNSERGLYLQGRVSESSERGLYIIGEITTTSERGLYVTGIAEVNSERSLYLQGAISTNSERELYLTGNASVNSERGLYVIGNISSASERLLYIIGKVLGSSERELYLTGQDSTNSERLLYLAGKALTDSERTLWAHGASATNRYWIGGTGNWNDTAHWSYMSGGGGGAPVPTNADNVYFDANSFSANGQTVTLTDNAASLSFTSTNVTNSPTLTGGWEFSVYGDFVSGVMSISGTYINLEGETTHSLDLGNATITNTSFTIGGGGVYTSLSGFDVIASGDFAALYVSNGTFNFGSYTYELANFYNYNNGNTNLGSATVTLTDEDFYFDGYFGYGSSVDFGTSTIIIDQQNTSGGTNGPILLINGYTGGIISENSHLIFRDHTTSVFYINTNLEVSFDSITFEPGVDIGFTGGQEVIANTWSFEGVNGNPVSLRSGNPGTRALLSSPSGSITGDYVTAVDTEVGGGATWTAGTGFIDSGNNMGWIRENSSERGLYMTGALAGDSERTFWLEGEAAPVTAADSERNLYTWGTISTESERGLYTWGTASTNSERNLYTWGTASTDSERGLYAWGTAGTDSERGLYITGSATTNSERGLYGWGTDSADSERGLYTTGNATANSERGLWAEGSATETSERTLYTWGTTSTNSERVLYTEGVLAADSERGLYTWGSESENSDRGLYTWGTASTESERGLYVIGVVEETSERGLYTKGVESVTLSIDYFDIDFYAETSSTRGLYVGGGLEETSNRRLYLKGSDTAESERTLYLYALEGSMRGLWIRGGEPFDDIETTVGEFTDIDDTTTGSWVDTDDVTTSSWVDTDTTPGGFTDTTTTTGGFIDIV